MTEQELEKLLREIHDRVILMHAILSDTNGNEGLCTRFRRLCKDYYTFKRNVMIVFAFLVGSGSISYGVFRLLVG